MKVLIQWAGGFDTPGPSNHLLKALIEDMLSAGISVHLVQGSIRKKNAEIPSDLKNLDKFTYDTLQRKDIAKSSFIRRYLEEVVYLIRSVRHWKKTKDVDVVFVRSCPTSLYAILMAKILLRKPVLYGIQDMYPGSAVNSGVIGNKIIANIFYFLQKVAYKKSDAISVISEDMKTKVIDQGVSKDKIYPIVNWFDDRTVHEVPWEENRFVKKYNLSRDKFYVQYAGTMGYVFDYKMILNVAELMKGYKDIQFQMIGQGSQKDAFMKEKEKRGLDNIIFYPLEPQEMVSDVYSTCSICLIPLKKGIIGNSVPSKAGLLMACNRAIVNSVDKDFDYYRMFNENEMGISASNDSPKEVADGILDLYHNKEKRERMAKNGQEFGKQYYSRSVNTQKFIKLFKKMVSVEGKK
ncbi:glycosyltransferase family 4 protein [Peribacillus butanolivorans]|uniref:glycosyltransferase family 4 protein n=1 Tax=Peribacillus butanolivorans TaxID=421767 RepID=UPI00369DDEA4